MKKINKKKLGFTLVELMVVVAIIGVLIAVAVPAYSKVTGKAEIGACAANLRTIESAVSQYNTLNTTKLVDFTIAGGALAEESAKLADFFQVVPKCPTAGTYSYTAATGAVACSVEAHTKAAAGN